jgi:NAD(P)H-hydrate epimerase
MRKNNRSSEEGIPRDLEENVPSVRADEMKETDRIAMEEFEITLPQMMENAGRLLTSLSRSVALSQLGSNVRALIRKGNNSGGGLVAARHLHNWGMVSQLFYLRMLKCSRKPLDIN